MPLYHCECCDFATHIKTHYTTHLNTNKHNINFEKYLNTQRRINHHINEPPKDNEPVSPIKILAGGALNHRKPKHEPMIAPQKTEISPVPSIYGICK